MTAKFNFVGPDGCYQNATFQTKVTWSDSEGDPYDLTRYAAYMQIRQFNQASVSILDLTSENQGLLLSSDGEITLTITKEQTRLLAAGLYVYDLILVNIDGFATRLMEGEFEVRPGVTRNVALTPV